MSGCGCPDRARDLLEWQLGYRLGADGIWRHPNGHTVVDANLSDHHFRLSLAAFWNVAASMLGV